MPPFLVGALFVLARLLFAIPILILLVRLYIRTKMNSFVWLIVALIIWPLLLAGFSVVLPMFIAQIASARSLPMQSTVSLLVVINFVEAVVSGTLMLIAVILLGRDLLARLQPAAVPPPATHF